MTRLVDKFDYIYGLASQMLYTSSGPLARRQNFWTKLGIFGCISKLKHVIRLITSRSKEVSLMNTLMNHQTRMFRDC